MNLDRGSRHRPSIVHIVNDDVAVGDSMCAILAAHGIEAVCYHSVTKFLEQPRSFDGGCLIIDMHLHKLDGLELVRRLRSEGESAPVILTSGNVNPSFVARAKQLKAVDVLDKPIEADKFLRLVERALGR